MKFFETQDILYTKHLVFVKNIPTPNLFYQLQIRYKKLLMKALILVGYLQILARLLTP